MKTHFRVQHISRGWYGIVLKGKSTAGLVQYLIQWENGQPDEWVSMAYLLEVEYPN